MTALKNVFLMSLAVWMLYACGDDDTPPTSEAQTFQVTIRNILGTTDFTASGETNFLAPGENQMIQFHAGPGQFLSFATMYVQSNDLFFAFADSGYPLYDDNGNPQTGDITAAVDLWDAGTEVNEEPGVGPNQAPRQSGADTGTDENGLIRLVDDGFNYPIDESLIRLTLAHDGGTLFTLTVDNVSGGSNIPSPLAPGVWAIHTAAQKLFEAGTSASVGIERIAEDGNNVMMLENLTSRTGYSSPFAPGVYAVHTADDEPFFTSGAADRGLGLEALAEDGDPGPLNTALAAITGVSAHGVFNTPDGATSPGPIGSGGSYSFMVEARPGDYLSLATMLIETNDLFYSFPAGGIALFNGDNPISGNLASQLGLYDAGTEVNEYPGAGRFQPIRGGGDSGQDENGTVTSVSDGFSYPSISESIEINVSTL